MRPERKRLLAAMTAAWSVAAALTLAGCGAATLSSATSSAAYVSGGTDSAGYDNGLSMETAADEGYASAAGESGSSGNGSPDSGDGISSVETSDTPEEIRKKIVYTGSVSLESKEYDTTKSELNELIQRYDGFVVSSNEYDNGWEDHRQRSYQVSVKIPSDHFDAFMNGIGGLSGKVTSQNVNSEDMTRTYSDNADRIEALETEQKTLLELLAKADSVESMIAIQSELTDVRTELAQLHHANSGIDYDVQYSSVDLSLDEVNTYEPTRITFGQRLKDAFGGSGENFVSFLQGLLIGLIYVLPYLVILAVLILILRAALKKKKKQKAAELSAGGQEGRTTRKKLFRKSGRSAGESPSASDDPEKLTDKKE